MMYSIARRELYHTIPRRWALIGSVARRFEHIHGPAHILSHVAEVFILGCMKVVDHGLTLWMIQMIVKPAQQPVPIIRFIAIPIVATGMDHRLNIERFFASYLQQAAFRYEILSPGELWRDVGSRPVRLTDREVSARPDRRTHCLDSLTIAAPYERRADTQRRIERCPLKFILRRVDTDDLEAVAERRGAVLRALTRIGPDVDPDAGDTEVLGP